MLPKRAHPDWDPFVTTSPWSDNLVAYKFQRLTKVTATKRTFANAIDPTDTMAGTAPT